MTSDDDERVKRTSTATLVQHVLSRHAVLSTANLVVSTILLWRAARAVTTPSFVSFVLGWPASELAHVLLSLQIVNLAVIHALNPALFTSSLIGQAALLVNAWSASVFARAVRMHWRARANFAVPMMDQGRIAQTAGSSLPLRLAAFIPLMSVVRRFRTVRRMRNVPYSSLEVTDPTMHLRVSSEPQIMRVLNAAALRGAQTHWNALDVIAMPGLPANSPVLMYVHGGGWMLGDKFVAASAMLQRLASRGIVVFSINYRMAPETAFPGQIIDVKRALIWVKRNCARYNGDARKVFVSGESAGGHLSALTAVTVNLPQFQPPEDPQADTSIAGAIPLCGVFDCSDRNGHLFDLHRDVPALLKPQGDRSFLQSFMERVVLQTAFHLNEAAFDNASPTWHAMQMAKRSDDAKLCPLMVVHGTHDALTSLEDAREFVKQVRAVRARFGTWAPGEADIFVDVEEGHHAFGYFPSPRAMALADATFDFVAHHARRIDRAA